MIPTAARCRPGVDPEDRRRFDEVNGEFGCPVGISVGRTSQDPLVGVGEPGFDVDVAASKSYGVIMSCWPKVALMLLPSAPVPPWVSMLTS